MLTTYICEVLCAKWWRMDGHLRLYIPRWWRWWPKVAEAAYRVGYSPNHLSTAFRRRFGISPGRLR